VSNLLLYASTVIIETEGKAWSVYISESSSWIFFKMSASHNIGFDLTGNSGIRSAVPKNPTQNWTRNWLANALQIYGHLNFPKMCELALRSVVGWSSVGRSVINIHTSYTDLIYFEQGVKMAKTGHKHTCLHSRVTESASSTSSWSIVHSYLLVDPTVTAEKLVS